MSQRAGEEEWTEAYDEDSGMTYEVVGKDIGWDKKGTKCLVVRKLTKALIETSGDYDSGLSVLSP